MIPKTIHYCWFGKSKLPEDTLKCIESWKRFFPEAEIIEWNETNFDVNMFDYTKEAYERGKYAFVSDVARLYVIYKYGGVYLDTDVELVKDISPLLQYNAYMGFQTKTDEKYYVNTGIGFGAKVNNILIKEMLDDYQTIHFVNEDGTLNTLSCPVRNTKVLEKYGLVLDGKEQTIMETTIFAPQVLCPMDEMSGRIEVKEDTYSIHHFKGSWLPKNKIVKRKLRKLLGPTIMNFYRSHIKQKR